MQHRLGEIERGVGGARRKGDDRIGERHLVVVKAGALRPEQDAALLARRRDRAHRDARGQDRLHLAALARGRRVNGVEIADRRLDARKDARGVQKIGRARRGGIGDLAIVVAARPALARIDQTQVVEAEIGHRPRAHADVHRQLRPNQNDRRTAAEPRLCPVRARANHRGRAIPRPRRRQSALERQWRAAQPAAQRPSSPGARPAKACASATTRSW